MSWVTLDDAAPLHEKQVSAGALACWLWTCGLAHCYRQESKDGFIPEAVVKLLYPGLGLKQAKRLVEAGLWEKTNGGYLVHDYLHWRERRFGAMQAERGAKGGSVSSEAKRQAALTREAKKRLARAGGTSDDHNVVPQGEPQQTTSESTEEPQARASDSPSGLPSEASPVSSQPPDLTRARPLPDAFGSSFAGPDDELPADWAPDAANIALAARLGLNAEDEAGEFAAHRRRDGFVCGNWPADFELWLRRSKKFAGKRASGSISESRAERQTRQQLEHIADLEAQERAAGANP